MSWKCGKCGCNNVSANDICIYCRAKHGIVTLAPEERGYSDYDSILFKIEIVKIDRLLPEYRVAFNNIGEEPMTPQEELFAEFFNSEKEFIADFTDEQLRARREELASYAFQARARLTAVDDVKRDKQKKTKGFQVSLEPDSLATEAINKVKTRQAKMDKTEKLIQSMMKTGMDRKTAESLLSSRTIADAKGQKVISKPLTEVKSEAPSKPLVNPFEAKKESKTATEVILNEETNTVIVKETTTEEVTKPSFVNPFAK